MRIPVRPPKWDELSKSLEKNAISSFAREIPALQDQQYIHWDKLRRLTPPLGLDHSQWWAILKFRRALNRRRLMNTSVDGTPFTFNLPDSAQRFLHEIDREAAGSILVSERVATDEQRDRYIISSLMDEAIVSSQLEGAATTRLVAKQMLRSGRKPRNNDERMIANNYSVMQRIRELQDEPLSKSMILDMHRVVTCDTLSSSLGEGRFRRKDELISIVDSYGQLLHQPPPADELDHRIAALCDFANGAQGESFVHPVIRAIVLHFWLAYEHPFVDGNGRCARALFYWSMLSSKYWLAEWISISTRIRKSPARYGRAFLYTETDDNDATYFILYHLELIRAAMNDLREHLSVKMQELRDAEILLRNSDGLNHRQVALLGHALRHPEARYTILSHQTSHGTVYETARRDLLQLESLKLLEGKKRGKAFVFFPAPSLHSRMKKLK